MTPTHKIKTRCTLDVPLFGSREESLSLEPHVVAAKWTINSHLEADALTLTLDWSSAGVDPRTIKNARVLFWIWDSSESWDPPDDPRFVGIVTEAERELDEESSRVTITAKDYTILFLSQKGLPADAIPNYDMTLGQAWESICSGTGWLDRSTGKIVSSVDALRGRLFFQNPEDANRRIGEMVPARMRTTGRPQFAKARDPWAVWTSLCGALGLHTFIDGDRCVVVRASEYYSDDRAVSLVYGENILRISEKVDMSKTSKGILLQSFDPLTGRLLEALYPPPGEVTIRTNRPGTSKRTIAEDYDVYVYGHVSDQTVLEQRAREAYEERSRQELQGKITTSVVSLDRLDGSPVSVFDLEPGSGIRVQWTTLDEERLRALAEPDRVGHFVAVGYDAETALLMARNVERTERLKQTHHIRTITIDLGERRFGVEIAYHNIISLEG